MMEETFGPVMPVMPFACLDEAVHLANDTQYGLSAPYLLDRKQKQWRSLSKLMLEPLALMMRL